MAVEKFGASERFACKVLGQNRSAFRKKKPDTGFEEAQLRATLRAVAVKHPTWGWRKDRWHLLTQQSPDCRSSDGEPGRRDFPENSNLEAAYQLSGGRPRRCSM
jgi:hypothetical protein